MRQRIIRCTAINPDQNEVMRTRSDLTRFIYKTIANIYDIDIEQIAKVKTAMNESRYPSPVKFEEGR